MCLDRGAYFPAMLYSRLLAGGTSSAKAEAVARKVQRRAYAKAKREGTLRGDS